MKKFWGREPWCRVCWTKTKHQICLIPSCGIVFTLLYFRFRIAFIFLNFQVAIGCFRRG